MFLQVHYLTSYHASLLNRDDAGLAKRISFGGVPRLRVSSQSQKKHWRDWMIAQTEVSHGWRSRHFFSRVLKQRLLESGMEETRAQALILQLAKGILKASDSKEPLSDDLAMKQPVLFGEPEAQYLAAMIREVGQKPRLEDAKAGLEQRLKSERKNFEAMLRQNGFRDPAAGFEGALFGRFVTSDILARVDAPVHVAHAFTTHALESEVDFFTVVDDLASEEETGAAHTNDMELGAGIFYGYVAVDTPLLISNLTGCRRETWRDEEKSVAKELLNLLIHAIAEVTPGAKLGATAPYARAQCLILEIGLGQPRSLANSFLRPVTMGRAGQDPMAESVRAMAAYLDSMESMYGSGDERRYVASLHEWPREHEPIMPLQQVIDHGLQQLLKGDAS